MNQVQNKNRSCTKSSSTLRAGSTTNQVQGQPWFNTGFAKPERNYHSMSKFKQCNCKDTSIFEFMVFFSQSNETCNFK